MLTLCSELESKILHLTQNCVPKGPLQDTITWYKIRHTGTQTAHWDIQNKEDLSLSDLSRFVLDVPVRSLRSLTNESVVFILVKTTPSVTI